MSGHGRHRPPSWQWPRMDLPDGVVWLVCVVVGLSIIFMLLCAVLIETL